MLTLLCHRPIRLEMMESMHGTLWPVSESSLYLLIKCGVPQVAPNSTLHRYAVLMYPGTRLLGLKRSLTKSSKMLPFISRVLTLMSTSNLSSSEHSCSSLNLVTVSHSSLSPVSMVTISLNRHLILRGTRAGSKEARAIQEARGHYWKLLILQLYRTHFDS